MADSNHINDLLKSTTRPARRERATEYLGNHIALSDGEIASIQVTTPSKRWQIASWGLVLLSLIIVTFLAHNHLTNRHITTGNSSGSITSLIAEVSRSPIENSYADQSPSLFYEDGDYDQKLLDLEDLWKQNQTHPEYYAVYVYHYLKHHQKLPDDYLSVSKKIAPDNGWFNLLYADFLARSAVKKIDITVHADTYHPVEVLDDELLAESLKHIEITAQKPAFTDYSAKIRQLKLAQLPPVIDNYSLNTTADLLYQYYYMPALKVFRVTSSLSAAMQQQSTPEGIAHIASIWLTIAQRTLHDDTNLTHTFVAKSMAKSMALAADHKLAGSPQLATPFRTTYNTLNKKYDHPHLEHLRVVTHHGNTMASTLSPIVPRHCESPPTLKQEDLKAGLRAEHALLDRMIFTWLTFAFAIITIISLGALFVRANFLRGPSHLLADQLCTKDRTIILVSAALPVLLYMTLNFLPVMAHHHYGIAYSGGIPHLIQVTGLAVASITLPRAIATWRLRRHDLPMRLTKPYLELFSAIIALTCMCLAPIGNLVNTERYIFGNDDMSFTFHLLPLIALLPCVLIGLYCMARPVINLKKNLLASQVSQRLAITSLAITTLCFATSLPIYHAIERHWYANDNNLPDFNHSIESSKFEQDVADQLRSETQAHLKSMREHIKKISETTE